MCSSILPVELCLEDVISWARALIDDFHEAAGINKGKDFGGMQQRLIRCIPPIPGNYKLILMLLSLKLVYGGCGLVVNDFTGCVMAISYHRIKATYCPLLAVDVAIYKGIQLACDTGLVPLEIESDAAVVVGLVNDMRCHDSEIGLIIDGIRLLM
ncbi:hypothetical protein QYF36_004593 [Acer negundo]|nr:hypothetical protein QYF36_004593 [Acer negundo]